VLSGSLNQPTNLRYDIVDCRIHYSVVALLTLKHQSCGAINFLNLINTCN